LTLSAHDCSCKLSQTKGQTATIVTLTNLGTVLWVLGQLDESIHVLEDALTKYRQVYPIINDVKYPSSDHLDIGKVYYNISIVRFLKHEYHLSHIWMDKAHCTWELQYGPCHIATARALDGLGKINLALGKVADAHRFHDAALRIKEYVMGKRHASTLFSMSNIASVLVQQGDYLKALRLLETVLQIQDDRLLEPNGQNVSNLVDVGNTLQKMGRIWFMMEKGDDGMRAFHQALSHYKAAGLDDSDIRVASILETIK
jgi:tetratricopeptide (TPR) repeat protein